VPVLEVDYEETVANLEGVPTPGRLVWPRMGAGLSRISPIRNIVQTASLSQVREPIYRRSVERWRNYESELGPLFECLEQIAREASPGSHGT